MSTPTLGQPVRFARVLRRTETHIAGTRSTGKRWHLGPHGTLREGIVVGTRTLQNGRAHWGYGDEGSWWQVESTVPAVLVATHIRKAPVYVHPDDLIPQETHQ